MATMLWLRWYHLSYGHCMVPTKAGSMFLARVGNFEQSATIIFTFGFNFRECITSAHVYTTHVLSQGREATH